MKTKVNIITAKNGILKCLSSTWKNWKLYPKFRCFVGYGDYNGSLNRDMTSTYYSNLKRDK